MDKIKLMVSINDFQEINGLPMSSFDTMIRCSINELKKYKNRLLACMAGRGNKCETLQLKHCTY